MSKAPMRIRVLEDGSVKIETDTISPASHVRAERFLAEVQKLLGGETTRVRKGHAHHHTHDHEHDEEHDHDHA